MPRFTSCFVIVYTMLLHELRIGVRIFSNEGLLVLYLGYVPELAYGSCCVSDQYHYDDVIMSTIASQITSLTIVYSTIYSGADQSKHQSSASLAFVWRIHRGPVNSPHKWPVTRKMFPFDDVIMRTTSHAPSQIAKFMRPTWGPPGSCRPQMGPMLAPWTFLTGFVPLISTARAHLLNTP